MIVILHNIRSLHNVGSIFRTADAVGCKKIYLAGITPAPIDSFGRPRPQFVKVSLGAEKYIDWEKAGSTARLMGELKKRGYKIFAIEQNSRSIPYYKVYETKSRKIDRVVLILGGEKNGLPQSILKRADKILEIPMRGKKESLNVAVAFGVAALHIVNSCVPKCEV